MPVRQRHQLNKRRFIPIHRIERLNRNPHPARSTTGPPRRNRILERLHIVMPRRHALSLRLTHPIPRARMNQRVVNNQIAMPRQRRNQRRIRRKPAAEIQRRLRPKKRRSLRFQRLMFWMIAPQQPRPASPQRHPARQRASSRLPQLRRRRQPQIIVRCEINPSWWRQRP